MDEINRDFKAGAVIGDKFKIIKKTGVGSLGEDIYLGIQESVSRKVFIHILPARLSNDEDKSMRFIQGIKLIAKLQHPNILPAFEAGKHVGRIYLVTGYRPENSLEDYISTNGKFTEKETIDILIQIADALQYAWETQKIINRNLMTENIILAEGNVPILTDFGMAKTLTEENDIDLTMPGITIGHPEVMSPEQVVGSRDLDTRSDMYCLGLIAYKMITGNLPFTYSSTIELMEAQLKETPELLCKKEPHTSKAFSETIAKALMKKREDRFSDWSRFIQELKKNKKQLKKSKEENINPSVKTMRVNAKTKKAPSLQADAEIQQPANKSHNSALIIIILLTTIIAILISYIIIKL